MNCAACTRQSRPICKECGETRKHHAHGLCRRCYSKQHDVKYRKAHKKEIIQTNKEYYAANRDKLRETNQRYHHAHGGKPASENKQCPVFLGVHVAERVLSKIFKDVREMPYGHKGYDFICNKGKKIDVKSSCIYISKRGNRSDSWSFCIKKNKIANYFLCLAFDNREDLNPLHIWLIPARVINHQVCASIAKSTLSKWDEYKLDINKVTACCGIMKDGVINNG